MKSTNDWHSVIESASYLSSDVARQLRDVGFVVMPGPVIPGGCKQLSYAYDRDVATASPADVHTGKTKSSTRVDDFVNRGAEFDGIYIYPPLLAACCQVIRGPFKLSGMRARTLSPGAPTERLHVDVKYRANGWPLVGCILLVDAFDAENGATRFVPGSHLQPREPSEVMDSPQDAHEEHTLACGPAGSVIIFNASVWHGHGANRSARPRRSIQLHFVPREAQASPDDHCSRMRPETLQRISDLAKYVLCVETSNKPIHAPARCGAAERHVGHESMNSEYHNDRLCRDCQIGYHSPFERFTRVAVHPDGPTMLQRCKVCGALWHEDLRSARLVTGLEAQKLYPEASL